MKKMLKLRLLLLIALNYISIAHGLTFNIPSNSNIVGNLQLTTVQQGQSLGDIGRKFDIGVYEMIEANPNLNPWVPTVGATVIVPTEFVLPAVERQGLVINLAEMRIYYFHPNNKIVTTHPIGIGKKGWNTPLGHVHIIEKVANPYWRPPSSIRADHANRGDILPNIVPPGPDNPLGKYAMRLSISTYLIHGTNKPGGIGFRSTSGCIRLLPEDIETLFPQIAVGTSVRIIHAPYKFGYRGNNIFLEAHQPLSEHYRTGDDSFTMLTQALEESAVQHRHVNWQYVQQSVAESKGYPILIQ